ncbi:MAG: PAS domain-containing protein [Pseudomonadota bacterium]
MATKPRTQRAPGAPQQDDAGRLDTEYAYRKLNPDKLDRELATRVLGQQDGLWILDVASNTLSVDGTLFEIMETVEPTSGSRHFDIYSRLHPDDVQHVRQALERHLIDREPYRVLMRFRHRDGHYLWVRSRGQATWDDDGNPVQMIGVMHDVSDAVELRQSLRDSEDRFSSISHSMPGALFRYTRKADGQDTIDYLSPGCEQVWEYAAEELEHDPSTLWNTVHPDDLADMVESVNDSADKLAPWVHAWRIVTKSGSEKWLEGRGTPIRTEKGDTVWHTMVFDRTERVRAQQALQQQKEMLHQSQKLASLGRIAGGVAHDFNNLLASILGNAEMLLDDTVSDEDRHRFATEIERAAYRGSALSQQLLAFGRRAHLKPSTESVRTILEEFRGMLARVIPENIEVAVVLPPKPLAVFIDRNQLDNALLNLSINARDAMPDGGLLTFSARQVSADALHNFDPAEPLAPGDYIELSVKDSGVGMSAELREKVVEPFFTTKPVGEGSGLGLSMVEGYARQSGGGMQICSTPGGGTTITLMLPAAEQLADTSSTAVPDVRETRAVRVLLAEDNPAVQSVLRQQLESFGHEVYVADDAATAVARLDAGLEPELLISDLIMPGPVRGTDLIRVALEKLPDLKVIVLSGYHRESAAESVALPKSITWLQKPVTMAHLRAAIADRLDSSA